MSQSSVVNSRDGPMDKASDYETEGSLIESLFCQLLHLLTTVTYHKKCFLNLDSLRTEGQSVRRLHKLDARNSAPTFVS